MPEWLYLADYFGWLSNTHEDARVRSHTLTRTFKHSSQTADALKELALGYKQ